VMNTTATKAAGMAIMIRAIRSDRWRR
jgi:hypothetical protein